MPTFKFWVEVERYDPDKDEWVSCTGQDDQTFIEPVSLGTVVCGEEKAREIAESFDFMANPGILKQHEEESNEES